MAPASAQGAFSAPQGFHQGKLAVFREAGPEKAMLEKVSEAGAARAAGVAEAAGTTEAAGATVRPERLARPKQQAPC